ncbi:MAG: leucine-rich repeat domain-containing protein [Clostridiales bacterium]
MAGVHCEICGGNLVAASKSTMFVCEHCGIQYPKNKVRRMFFKDAGVDSNAPATKEEMDRFHHMVEKYFKEENFVDAENTTNRILSANPDDKIGNYYFDILCKMKMDFQIERGTLVKYIGKEAIVRIPKIVTAIDNSAFKNNNIIEEIFVPQGVLSLGHDAFNNCPKLKKVELPISTTFIGYRCFFNCTALVDINITDNLKFLGDYAFAQCESLKNIHISKKLTAINRHTFASCSSLENIEIAANITAIGCGAFKDCKKLKSIGSVEKVPFIGENAFKGCDSMEHISVKEHRFMSNGWEKYQEENQMKY